MMAGRSIPAHAGEPAASEMTPWLSRVYPRPRGGTARRREETTRCAGLSPPTRGNLRRPCRSGTCAGSIPAHAGEPRRSSSDDDGQEVYPRPRGGTRRNRRYAERQRGLSPPTRGNQSVRRNFRFRRRSIPAHAGEPASGGDNCREPSVYPRPRGGTTCENDGCRIRRGLSPPTRGNPGRWIRRGLSPRSIPAHAGEPSAIRRDGTGGRVYPRPRGGTRELSQLSTPLLGLSPPTRGNPPNH